MYACGANDCGQLGMKAEVTKCEYLPKLVGAMNEEIV
jgi:hypothetical protein